MKRSVWKKFRFRFIIFIKEITRGKEREKKTRTAHFIAVKVWKEEKQMHDEEKNELVLLLLPYFFQKSEFMSLRSV